MRPPVSVSLRDTRSGGLYARARRYLPGGVNSPVRAMRAIGRDPLFVERGEGAEITDVDGNTYVDYVCSWGPLILGHANPAVVAAIQAAARAGTSFGAPTLAEVITGLRVAPGGAQELTGVIPDITLLGKVFGGGLPAAAYGGSRELLERVAPVGDVYQAGTLSGNPIAMAAGLATLAQLDEQAYLRLQASTDALAAGLREAAAGVPVQVTSATGLLTVFFSSEPVTDYATAQRCDLERHAAWCRALLARGVYPPPSQFEAWFPSLAHTPQHISRTLEAAAAAFHEVA